MDDRPTAADPAADAHEVRYENTRGVARITLDRPGQGNALDASTVNGLLRAIRRAHADRSGVIVLSATGRYFCVGGDLSSFAAAPDMSEFVDDLAESLHRVVSELVRSPAVVVAAVQGHAAGAGVSLAAAADIVVATESSTFTLAYSQVGLSNDGGSSMLVHTLGLHRALRMALLNDRLTSAEAHLAGLVARVVPDDSLDTAVDDVVGTLTRLSAEALSSSKQLLRTTAEPNPEGVMRRETLSIRRTAAVDGPEGVAAFLEKRRPPQAS